MSVRAWLLPLSMLLAAGVASGACKDHDRDPMFVLLEVPDGSPRPATVTDFAFIDDTTTMSQVRAKVGPPDAVTGSGISIFVWCLDDGTEVAIGVSTGDHILYVRHKGKAIFKAEKKKK